MSHIQILQGGEVIAEHTTDTPLSHYGQSVWVVQEPEPQPGHATWLQGAVELRIDIICVRDGWLICKQPDGLLCGIIWSDGSYFANVIVNEDNVPQKEWRETGLHVRDTVFLGEGLGSILPGVTSCFNFIQELEEPEKMIEPEINKLSRADWEHKMHEAQAFSKVQPERHDYWSGVQRGLRRAYHGENFGTDKEHLLWLEAACSEDPARKQRGEGYRDGLKGKSR